MQRASDGKIFAAKIIKKAKLEENKYKDKFVVRILHWKNVIFLKNNLKISKKLAFFWFVLFS